MNTCARGSYVFIRARFAEVCAEEVCYVSGNQDGKNSIQLYFWNLRGVCGTPPPTWKRGVAGVPECPRTRPCFVGRLRTYNAEKKAVAGGFH